MTWTRSGASSTRRLENLGDWLALYQIHSATPDSGVLENDAVLSAMVDSGLPLGVQRQRRVAGRDDRPRGGTGDLQRRPSYVEPARARRRGRARPQRAEVIVKEALANGRLAARDAEALAAALARPWGPWSSAERRRSTCWRRLRARERRPPGGSSLWEHESIRLDSGGLDWELRSELALATPPSFDALAQRLAAAGGDRARGALLAQLHAASRRQFEPRLALLALPAARRNSQQKSPIVTIEPSIIMIAPAALWSLAGEMPHSAWPAAYRG